LPVCSQLCESFILRIRENRHRLPLFTNRAAFFGAAWAGERFFALAAALVAEFLGACFAICVNVTQIGRDGKSAPLASPRTPAGQYAFFNDLLVS
ncbi:MAG TPA: hypothetical protein VIT23_01370, partial [Terrimicrobiaceae bacterium]